MPGLFTLEVLQRRLRREIEGYVQSGDEDALFDYIKRVSLLRDVRILNQLVLLSAFQEGILFVFRMDQLDSHWKTFLSNSDDEFVFSEGATSFDRLAGIMFYNAGLEMLESSEPDSPQWKKGLLDLEMAADIYLCETARQLMAAPDTVSENIQPILRG